MKKILLLVIGLLGITTATAQDYDKKFKIQVNGTEEWSPYPRKSGIDFQITNSKAIAVRQNGASVSFTGKQVGNSTIIAKCEGEVKWARDRTTRLPTIQPTKVVPKTAALNLSSCERRAKLA